MTLAVCCITLTACSDGTGAEPSSADAGLSPSADARLSRERAEALERKHLEMVAPDPAAAVQGEVPDQVMTRVRAHLAGRTGAPADSFEVVRAEQHEWPSGAMGCPQPGMTYTQSLVRGYWVVLRHDQRDYDYRVAESGHFVLCEGMILDDPPAR